MALTTSTTPITSTYDGEVIANLDLTVTGNGPAINITSDNVTIENVHIHAAGGGDGIDISNATGTKLSYVEVDGPVATNNAGGDGSDGVATDSAVTADHLTFRDMGTGFYAVDAPGQALSNIVGFDMQGPFPGGQLVQFSRSSNSTLTNFSLLNNAATSHPEDDVSVYDSQNVKISNGVIDGDNSPSGVGIMFEGNSQGGSVENVDAIHMGDGAFSSYSNDVSFDHTRSFDNIATDQGRGAPLSGGVIWGDAGSGVSITNSTYTNPASPGNIIWPLDGSDSISEAPDAQPMSPVTNTFSWTTGTVASGLTSLGNSPDVKVSATPDDVGLTGTSGNDTIDGGSDGVYHDMTGSSGADTFRWHHGSGLNEIENFSGAQGDVIEVDKSLFSSFASLVASANTVNTTDSMITNGSGGGQLILDGLKVSQYTAADFKFV